VRGSAGSIDDEGDHRRQAPLHAALEIVERFEPRIADPFDFARVNRILLLSAPSGVGLDIAFGGLPFEEDAVNRSSLFTCPPDVPLRACSAEDLIVFKASPIGPRTGSTWMAS